MTTALRHTQQLAPEIERLAYRVIGAAIEVHQRLGPGWLESVYEESLSIELQLQGIPFVRQHEVSLDDKGRPVGTGKIDLLIDHSIVVELKAVNTLAGIHTAQVISYLRITNCQLGLLINFNVPMLRNGIERIVLSAL